MKKEDTVLDEFSAEFKPEEEKVDPFKEETPLNESVPEKDEEEKIEPRKNRQHRRLEAKLQEEREANIALSERVKVLSETSQFRKEVAPDADIHQVLFGNQAETPETRATALSLERVLTRHTESAKAEALKEFEARQEEAVKAQKKAESFIDGELESLEDEYDVDLTSDSPAARKARREFLEVVQKLSPKDEEGNIKDYADFDAAYDIYRSTKEKPNASRQKDLAARSMVNSNSAQTKDLDTQIKEEYLRNLDII